MPHIRAIVLRISRTATATFIRGREAADCRLYWDLRPEAVKRVQAAQLLLAKKEAPCQTS